jgi:hypothetical protein
MCPSCLFQVAAVRNELLLELVHPSTETLQHFNILSNVGTAATLSPVFRVPFLCT